MMKLTRLQYEMLVQLDQKGIISWTHTTSQEASTLNILVKKGLAEYVIPGGRYEITQAGRLEASKGLIMQDGDIFSVRGTVDGE